MNAIIVIGKTIFSRTRPKPNECFNEQQSREVLPRGLPRAQINMNTAAARRSGANTQPNQDSAAVVRPIGIPWVKRRKITYNVIQILCVSILREVTRSIVGIYSERGNILSRVHPGRRASFVLKQFMK